jgi:uncharacterized protein (DUF1015 family)
MDSEGVRILATHRAVRNLEDFDKEAMITALSQYFEIIPSADDESLAVSLTESAVDIGVIVGNSSEAFKLKLKPKAFADARFMSGVDEVGRGLAVNVLHEGILGPVLGLGPDEVAGGHYVDYFRDRRAMARQIKAGEYQLGFLLNPTSLEQVKQVSESGKRMPQKSTDFFPKLLTGLVLMKMDIKRG